MAGFTAGLDEYGVTQHEHVGLGLHCYQEFNFLPRQINFTFL